MQRKRRSLAQQFWPKVQKTEGCWIWTGCRAITGHGNIRVTRETNKSYILGAHRASWELHFGLIPEGLEVCHNCPEGDNPSCVNPDHLFLGTHADNLADAGHKGRMPRGIKHHNAKLTEAQVIEMLGLMGSGRPQHDIAKQFGVQQMTVSRIFRRDGWKHLGNVTS